MTLDVLIRQRKSLVLILLGLAVVLLVGTQVSLALAKEEATKMAHEIGQIEMKTICVGRFLVDVPADAQISYRPAFLEGWDINSDIEESETAFSERLSATEAKHKAAKNGRGESSLELAKAIDTNETFGKIFVYGRQWTYHIANGEKIHSSAVTIDASVRIKGVSFDFDREITDSEEVAKLVRYISQLSPRRGPAIPNEPGFCFDEGFVRDPLSAAENERVSVFIGLKGHRDVAIAATTMAGLKHEKTLLQRDAENNVKQSNLGNFKTLRTGPREINGFPGEEILDVIMEPNGTRGQSFMWESLPKQDSVYRPYFLLELNTGHGQPGTPVNSSLSDARALALWERISSSLRLRPTSSQPTVVEKPAVPLGSLGLASSKCRQTGWWQCTDGSAATDIVGGSRRYFTEGQLLPQVVLSTPGTFWQNIRGKKPTFTSSTPSSWRLIDRRKAPRTEPSPFLAAAGLAVDVPIELTTPMTETVKAGAQIRSGLACPASGWWECADTSALDGTRWFACGDMVPPATVPAPTSFGKKFRGAGTVTRTSADWRLMRAAETPSLPSTSANASTPDDAGANPQQLANGRGADGPEEA